MVVHRGDGRGQVASFRIRPLSASLYYTVRVFRNLRTLRAYAASHRGRGNGRIAGLASSWTGYRYTGKRVVVSRNAGEILLSRTRLTGRIVSHECAHLALAWARRLKIDIVTESGRRFVSPSEERFCHALSDLVNQTYHHLYRLKVL